MSVVVRKSLGRQLRALRLKAGKTAADIDTSGVASTSKLHRIETGAGPFRLETVWALCQVYGVDDATKDRLAEMARHTNDSGWWEDYTDVMPSWFGTYVELESAATTAFSYHSEAIPGLLQSPAYQRAMFGTYPDPNGDFIRRQLQMRSERQRGALDRKPPLEMTAILGEEALLREVGGHSGMVEQRQHLLRLDRRAHLTVRIVPCEAGAHPAMKGAFTILRFDGDSVHPDIVYLETYVGGRYIEDQMTVAEFHRMFQKVHRMSVSIEEFAK
jgi:Domain of unknown function (DUF5753)/Helix-turn-helix domain